MSGFFAATGVGIGPVDGLIVVAYLLATTLFGVWLGRGQADNRDYFLGAHRLPTWALLVSIVATETSTVTFLSVPGKSYVDGGSFIFLQIALGYIVADHLNDAIAAVGNQRGADVDARWCGAVFAQ